MFAKAANSTPAVPSRNALRVLRQLAFAGSTVGGFCTVGAVTYDVHRRVRIAEQIIDNKRTLQTSAPNYDATASARRLAVMMEAAEAGEFMGLDSLKNKPPLQRTEGEGQAKTQGLPDSHADSSQRRSRSSRLPDAGEYSPFSPARGAEMKQQAAARVALAREAGQPEEDFDESEVPVEKRITRLISNDKEIEAANLFLQHVHSGGEVPITLESRAVARQLFAANCMKGNVFLARTLFERMERVSEIDVQMWATMMHLLAKEGHIDSVGVIYERHHRRLNVPAHLLEVVLRSLLESRRVNSAKRLFYRRIRDDENGGLCGAYMDGLWRKTRSIDLIVAEFRTILSSLANLERSPTEKVFNPLVKAFVESGQYEDAEALVADMPAKYNVQPGSRTLGILLYYKALSCDWEGVFAGLREMHRLGHTRDKRGFAFAFDRVFLEYYPTHSGREIFDFLISCIEQFELVPDKILHRHILEALVERGDSNLVGQITRIAKERKWNTGVDEEFFLNIMSTRRVSMQDSPVGIWRVLQAAKKHYGLAASSRRILGTGAASYSLDRGVIYPIHKPADETFATSLNELVHNKAIGNHIPLRKHMENHINGGRFEEALKAFRTAGSLGYVIQPNLIHLAVISTILAHGQLGLVDAQIIIKSEWPDWVKKPKKRTNPAYPRIPPIFFQQILQLKEDVSDLTLFKMAIFEYYNICQDTPTLTVKHHALTSLTKRLISTKNPRKAINILTAVYKSTWRKTHGFDQVLFKMWIRAFAATKNLRGVWWCMLAVLTRSEPIKQEFVVEAKRLVPILEQRFASQEDNDRIASRNIKILRRLSSVLEKKMQGDSHWVLRAPRPDLKKQRRTTVVSRPAEYRNALPTRYVEQMVDYFDEEIELDLLVNGNPHSEDELEQRWGEASLLSQHRCLPEDPGYPRYLDWEGKGERESE